MKIIIVSSVLAFYYTLTVLTSIFFKSTDNANDMKNMQYTPKFLRLRTSLKNTGDGTKETVPSIPGNNSHYIDGKSRYIWIPDGNDKPQLVDLQEPIYEGAVINIRQNDINKYYLFTQKNPKNSQELIFGKMESVWNSNYKASKPIKIIVHCWMSNKDSEINHLITSAFLSVIDANVIVVDWGELANSNYITASNGVPTIGEYLGNFLIWLIDTTECDWSRVHLVGFSLGAHVVGNAGRTASNRPARITGLDPAGPLWKDSSDALIASDGQYVETIHTDGGILGLFSRIAQSDFYPNGGCSPQPGCGIFSTCSHSRAYHLFASTVRTDHLVGHWCNDLDEAESVICVGKSLHMGNAVLDKKGEGIYALTTKSEWPF